MADINSVNEHGVPLHACNGFRCDEHWWLWLRWRTQRGDFGEKLRQESIATWGALASSSTR